jgi:ABC-type multidrug transport system ATPase subunit
VVLKHPNVVVVGDAHVRGVSGGERKRVSIAEMMATRACVLSWDNSTRGLDASTALSYAKSLRIMTNIFQTTMFVTLYQAGEGIYDQFDKILLLNEGRCVYYGPTKGARDYMVSLGYKNLPRQTTADYLTGCTDENERQFRDDIDVTQVPKTPEEMEQAYLNSSTYQTMEQERIDYTKFLIQEQRFQRDFMEAVKVDQGKGVNPKVSPIPITVSGQIFFHTYISSHRRRLIFVPYCSPHTRCQFLPNSGHSLSDPCNLLGKTDSH